MAKEPTDVIIGPVSSESALDRLEKENKLTFIVSLRSNKPEIKWAVEKLYGVKVKSVRTMITNSSEKKAVVALEKEFSASELATKLGLL
ncbi:MAG: 50S ribosomal protein L23 [Candidatus Verstraetearchaeota archaeon]|nr:50S ribosomal protein L23 [Candidatus Verstraetearchaeota archaeon]